MTFTLNTRNNHVTLEQPVVLVIQGLSDQKIRWLFRRNTIWPFHTGVFRAMVTAGVNILSHAPNMKPVQTKAQARSELEQQIQHYLQEGGVVHDVPRGVSGHQDNRNLFGHLGENPPRQERTPLDDVVKTLEARKHPQSAGKKHTRPRKKLITDDFGEPLRWVWVDE